MINDAKMHLIKKGINMSDTFTYAIADATQLRIKITEVTETTLSFFDNICITYFVHHKRLLKSH